MPSARLIKPRRSFRLWAVALLLVLTYSVVRAHDPAQMELARLGQLIKQQGPSTSIYLKRSEIYRSNRWWAEALADIDRAEALAGPEQKPVVVVRRVAVLLGSGRPQAALTVIQHMPNTERSPELRVLEGRTLEALGRNEAALTAYRQAFLESRAVFYPAWVDHYTALLSGLGRHSEALRVTETALQRWGDNSVIQQRAAELEMRLGRVQEALARIDSLQSRSQRKDTWLFRKAELLRRAGLEEVAQRFYRQARAALRQLPEYMRSRPQVRELENALQQRLDANG